MDTINHHMNLTYHAYGGEISRNDALDYLTSPAPDTGMMNVFVGVDGNISALVQIDFSDTRLENNPEWADWTVFDNRTGNKLAGASDPAQALAMAEGFAVGDHAGYHRCRRMAVNKMAGL